ncbi:Plug domain-containing protein, partial [Burkholderia cepacia]|uniref:Plug domain-containing protein n=1 Tax=Burkholderia cepacia TaxID=292 RepID=UPI002445B268
MRTRIASSWRSPAVAAPDVFATEGKQGQSTTESPDSGTSASSAESTVLEPVTVTARKTTERLQDVPESITVLQAKTLKESPFDPGVAIAGHAPNVQWVSRATGSQWFSIRGVSSLGTPANYSDGTIAFNVDGVPNSMMSASNMLLDVDHIEVLRGPQGTLWGSGRLPHGHQRAVDSGRTGDAPEPDDLGAVRVRQPTSRSNQD